MLNQRIVATLLSLLLLLCGCQSKTSESRPSPAPQAAQPQAQPPAPSPASSPQASKPAPPEAKPPGAPILLTGAPMGGVRFQHAQHPLACATCHHPSRQPKPGAAPQQACTSCHTQPPQPGMQTGKQAAFHNPTATAGTCIDCHKKSGGTAPTKCLQCHQKSNV